MIRWPARRIQQESSTLTMSDALVSLGRLVMPASAAVRDDYEASWATILGGPTLAIASGRGAIVHALRGAGVATGDEVVVTGYTCVAVPAAVMSLGAIPRYADVDPASGNLTPSSVAAVLTPRTRAVIVQHTLGNPAPTAAIRQAAGPPVWIIEDAAHAIGSRGPDGPIGHDGDWTIASTEQSKGLSTGQGGLLAAITDRARSRLTDPDWRAPLDVEMPRHVARRWLVRSGLEAATWACAPGDRDWAAQVMIRILHRLGLSRISSADAAEAHGDVPAWRLGRLDPSLAASGARQRSRLDAILGHRRRIAEVYREALGGALASLTVLPGADPVWLRYPVLIDDAEAIGRSLRIAGWDVGGRWFSHPVYPPRDPAMLGYVDGSCPAGETLGRRMLNLPTHPRISPDRAAQLARDVLSVTGR